MPSHRAPGRLGLLAILFEFIEDNKKVWVVGSGSKLQLAPPSSVAMMVPEGVEADVSRKPPARHSVAVVQAMEAR